MKRLTVLVLLATFVGAVVALATDDDGRYRVRKGDCLWNISGAELKDPFNWPSIWKLNTFIDNPDLIYPGELLVIPGRGVLPAPEPKIEERVEEVVAAPPPKKVIPVTREIYIFSPRIIAVSTETAPAIIAEAPTIPAREEYFPPAFVAQELEAAAVVLGSPEEIEAIPPGVPITLDRGSASGLGEGERLWVVHRDRFLNHPLTGEPVGWLFKVVAAIEIDCLTDSSALAQIVEFYDVVSPGDLCVPPAPASEIPELAAAFEGPCIPPEVGLKVTLIAPVPNRLVTVPGDRIILDRGSLDGLNVGDHLVAFQDSLHSLDNSGELPTAPRFLGEAVIIEVSQSLSAGLIVSATRELEPGANFIQVQ